MASMCAAAHLRRIREDSVRLVSHRAQAAVSQIVDVAQPACQNLELGLNAVLVLGELLWLRG